jgi:hypothetical protein
VIGSVETVLKGFCAGEKEVINADYSRLIGGFNGLYHFSVYFLLHTRESDIIFPVHYQLVMCSYDSF